MKKLFFAFFISISSFFTSKAQFLDSIQASINRKGSFSFGFNSRNSLITNNDAHIFAFTIGVTFDKKIGIGGGLNVLNSYITKNELVNGSYVSAQLNFYFFSYYVEYILRLGKHWEIDIPFSFGLGNSSYTYSQEGVLHTQSSHFILPIEPSVEVDYDFNKYVGLYLQTGYRIMLVNNPAINEDFNSPTWSFGILIFPLEIYAGLFPHTKLAHLIEDH